jgi:hypothetical protein
MAVINALHQVMVSFVAMTNTKTTKVMASDSVAPHNYVSSQFAQITHTVF